MRAMLARIGGQSLVAEATAAIVSWPEKDSSRDLLCKLVPGFGEYANNRPVIDMVDLCLWAMACGSYDLTRCLWARCRCPLRASLVLRVMCKKMRKQSFTSDADVEKLRMFEEDLGAMSTGILDFIDDHDQDATRKVLLHKRAEYARLGAKSGNEVDCLHLATMHNVKDFASHQRFQQVVDMTWRGRSHLCGNLKVVVSHNARYPTFWTILQAMLPFAPVMKLEKNDLFDERKMPLTSFLRRTGLSPISRVVGILQIPMFKRMYTILFRIAFSVVFSIVAMLEPCGQLTYFHLVLSIWTCALAFDELFEAYSNLELYLLMGGQNRLELILIALLFGIIALRIRTIHPPATTAVDLIDFLNQHFDYQIRDEYSAGYLDVNAAPQRRQLEEAGGGVAGGGVAGGVDQHGRELQGFGYYDCGWSWEIELLRTMTAIAALLIAVRMFECFALLYETGVLIITAAGMARRLLVWFPLVFILSFGQAVAMNVLAPNYRLEHSPGPMQFPIETFEADFSAGGPFFSPFWAVYGYFEPGALAQGRGTAFVAPGFMWLCARSAATPARIEHTRACSPVPAPNGVPTGV
jgi:hypothetical protein